jgi:YHS domain-containing protein
MKKLFNQSGILFAFVLVCALTVSGFAQEAKKDDHSGKSHDHAAQADKKADSFKGKGDGIETCPVSGEAITSKDVKAEFFGRTVYFCCDDCLADAKKNPGLYLKKTQEEQNAAVKGMAKPEGHDHHAQAEGQTKKEAPKFLGRGDGIETCPVTGEKVDKNIKAEINGRTVYFCCADCIDDVKKNPELYLKKVENK